MDGNDMAERDPDAAFSLFRALANDRLAALLNAYGLVESKAQLYYPEMWLSFDNATTRVTIYFEYDSGIWFGIDRLGTVRGKRGVVESSNFDDILALRAPASVLSVPLREFDEVDVSRILAEAGELLRLHADDVLRGEFAVFEMLRPIYAARRAKLDEDFDKI
jgi:hypothetical protein